MPWLERYLADDLTSLITKQQAELGELNKKKANTRNSKKVKQNIGMIQFKLTQAAKVKDKIDEILPLIDPALHIDARASKQLKLALIKFLESPDDEIVKS